MANTVDLWIGIGLLVLIWGFFQPSMCYYLVYFQQNKRTPPLVGRNPVLVYGIVFLIIAFEIQKTLVVLCYFYNWSESNLKILFMLRFLMTFAAQPAVTLMVTRFYLGYYRVRLAVHSLRDEWKHLINPDAANHSWIIKYRHTLGNARFMENRVAYPICAIEAIVTAAIGIKFPPTTVPAYLSIILTLSKLAILLWLWKTLPVYRDVFNVRSEILGVFAVLMLVFVTFLFLSSIGSLNKSSSLWWLNPLLLSIEVWLCVMTVTARVLYQNREFVTPPKCNAKTFSDCWGPRNYGNDNNEKDKQDAKLSTQIHLFASSKASTVKTDVDSTESDGPNSSGKTRVKSVSVLQEDANQLAAIDVEVGAHLLRQRVQTETADQAENNELQDAKKPKIPDLRDVLGDKVGFNLFMEHLFAELSPETLLAYLEMCQFHYKNCSLTEKDCSFHQKFVLNEALPRSAIVDSQVSLADQIASLVDKYLKEGASYEVNVGHNVRMACIQKCKPETIANKSKEELYNIFDPVVFALYRLMNSDSFQRFVYTESFRRYANKYTA